MQDYEAKRAEERQRNEDVQKKLDEVGRILKLKPDPKQERDSLSAVGGGEVPNYAGLNLYIRFSAGYGKRRIEVSASYPRHRDGAYVADLWYTQEECAVIKAKTGQDLNYRRIPRPSITISADKTPEQIAKDIKRRFMPDAIDYWARTVKEVNERSAYEDLSTASLRIAKGEALDEYEVKERRFHLYIGKDGERPRIEASASNERIDLKIDDITPETARDIIARLRKEYADRP